MGLLTLLGAGSRMASRPFNPSDTNPDLYFDATLAQQSVNNDYADCTVFYRVATWKNQVLGGNDALQASAGNQPMLRRQEIGAQNALYFYSSQTACWYTITRYADINYEFNEAFWISGSIRTLTEDTQFLIDNRSADFTTGMAIFIDNGKLNFCFCDDVNAAMLGGTLRVEMDVLINDGGHYDFIIQNTTGIASGIKFYLNGVEQTFTTIIDTQNTTSIQSSEPYYICHYPANNNSYFDGSISTLLMGSGVISLPNINSLYSYTILTDKWYPIKSLDNPKISGSTFDTEQSYPNCWWQFSGDLYAFVGSTQSRIVLFKSTDNGDTWSEQGLALSAGPEGTYIIPGFITIVGSTFYLDYMEYNTQYKWCRASGDTSDFTTLTKMGVVLDSDDTNAVFNNDMDAVIPCDRVKVGSVYHWFFMVQDGARFTVCRGTSATLLGIIIPVEILFQGMDVCPDRYVIQKPQIFKVSWGWVMNYTVGVSSGQIQERNIRSAYSTNVNPTGFTLVNEDYLNILANSWEQQRVYYNSWLKETADDSFQNLIMLDSSYPNLYSGHDINLENKGLTGRANIDAIPDIRNGRALVPTVFNLDPAIEALPNKAAWIEMDQSCYYGINNFIWQVNNQANKFVPLIAMDSSSPVYTDNGINSLPSAVFDGNKEFKFYKGLGNPSNFTIVITGVLTNMDTNRHLCGWINEAGSNDTFNRTVRVDTDGKITYIFNDGTENVSVTQTTNSVITLNTPFIIIIKYTNGNDYADIYVNTNVSQPITKISTDCTSNGSVVKNYSVGSVGDYILLRTVGQISQFGWFNSVLNGTDTDTVFSYLTDKYNVS